MILKFEEYINERLWSKGVNRSKTGELRKEDLSKPFYKYLENIDWVDLGHPDYLFATKDYPLQDSDPMLSIRDIYKLHLPEGVDFMGEDVVHWLENHTQIKSHLEDDYIVRDLKGGGEMILHDIEPFKNIRGYFLKSPKNQMKRLVMTDTRSSYASLHVTPIFNDNTEELLTNYYFYIKLLKLKHNVSEGLWSKGVNRSKTGDKRGEDKFTQADLEIFDDVHKLTISESGKELTTLFYDFRKCVKDMYGDYVYKCAKTSGLLKIGLSKEDTVKLPDFDKTYNIQSLKNVRLHITYIDKLKEFRVMCGNNKDEYDVTEKEFGKSLFNIFEDSLFSNVKESYIILRKNIEFNKDLFFETLSNYVYKQCLKDFTYDIKQGNQINTLENESIEIDTLYTDDPILKKFFFEGLDFDDKHQPIVNLGGVRMSSDPLKKQIVQIYTDAYNDALSEVKRKYPNYDFKF